jgi:hypothetical protein
MRSALEGFVARMAGADRVSIEDAKLLSGGAISNLADASYTMLPAPMPSVEVTSGHKYAMSLSAVQLMAEVGPLLVGATPLQLQSIDPDEIDVAMAADSELEISVQQVEQAAHDYLLELGGVQGESTSDGTTEQLERLTLNGQGLRKALVALREVTKLRFTVTR